MVQESKGPPAMMEFVDYFKVWNWWRSIKKEAFKEVKMPDTPTPAVSQPAVTPAAPVTKPGWKTSEFWLTAFSTGGALIGQVSGLIPPPWGLIAGAVMTCGYQVTRAFVKTPPPAAQ